jgi:hypothetical protein
MKRIPVLLTLTIAVVLTMGAACSKTDDTGTSGTAGTTSPTTAARSGTTAATTAGSTPGSTPGTELTTDQAIDALPIGTTQKDCLKDKINIDPGLKSILESQKQVTKSEATKFINVSLSCMSRVELTAMLTSNMPDAESPQAKCQASKVAQMTEDQLAGFIAQDPATLAEIKPEIDLCNTVGSTAP